MIRKNVHGEFRRELSQLKAEAPALGLRDGLKEGFPDLHADFAGHVSLGRQDVLVLTAQKGSHFGTDCLMIFQIHQHRRGVTPQGNVGEADLDHEAAIGDLVEVPLFPAQGVTDPAAVVVEDIVPGPAGGLQAPVRGQQLRGCRIFPLFGAKARFEPAFVAAFHRVHFQSLIVRRVSGTRKRGLLGNEPLASRGSVTHFYRLRATSSSIWAIS